MMSVGWRCPGGSRLLGRNFRGEHIEAWKEDPDGAWTLVRDQRTTTRTRSGFSTPSTRPREASEPPLEGRRVAARTHKPRLVLTSRNRGRSRRVFGMRGCPEHLRPGLRPQYSEEPSGDPFGAKPGGSVRFRAPAQPISRVSPKTFCPGAYGGSTSCLGGR